MVLFADFYFIMANAAIIGGQEMYRLFAHHSGFAVGACEAFDGFERGPQGFYDHLDHHAVGLREHSRLNESFF